MGEPGVNLAKDCVDVGLNTANVEPMVEFWRDQIDLTYEGSLPVRRGVVQHRFDCDGSVIKVNAHAAAIAEEPPSGYRELIVAKPGLANPKRVRDPDGNSVCLWPVGDSGITQIGVRMAVRDLARHRSFCSQALGLQEQTPLYFPGSASFAAGRSCLLIEEDRDAPVDAGFGGFGWRYITFQVFKVDDVHERMVASGAREAMAPRTLGTTARISMVLDPDGNWIELSQRASLVGSLD
jgi:predicted enzyme related to lactoylglutathione lyase